MKHLVPAINLKIPGMKKMMLNASSLTDAAEAWDSELTKIQEGELLLAGQQRVAEHSIRHLAGAVAAAGAARSGENKLQPWSGGYRNFGQRGGGRQMQQGGARLTPGPGAQPGFLPGTCRGWEVAGVCYYKYGGQQACKFQHPPKGGETKPGIQRRRRGSIGTTRECMQSKEGQAQQLDPAERMKALGARGIEEEGGPDGDWDGDVMVDLDLDPLVDPAVEPVGELPRRQERDEGMVTGYEGGIGDAMRIVKEAWITLERLGRDERWEPSVNPDWENELMKELPPPNQFQAGKLQAHWGVLQEYFRISGNDIKTADVVLKWS
eukprot:gene18963-25536_t